MKTAFCLLIAALFTVKLTAQRIDEDLLLRILSNRSEKNIAVNDSLLISIYEALDTAARVQFLDLLKKKSESSDLFTAARSLAWRGIVVRRWPFYSNEGGAFMQLAINKAVESGNEYLMVECFEIYATHCLSTDKPETALFYFLKSAELRKKLGDQYFYTKNMQLFGALGEILFRMQEYEQAIQYIRLGVSMPGKIKNPHTPSMNTLGLAYQALGKYDSALYWYDRSLQSARKNRDTVWEAIVSGNIGSLYFEREEYNKALPLLWKDYNTTIHNEKNNAGNTLHRIALIYLRQGKTDSAMILAKKGFRIVTVEPPVNAGFVRNAYMAVSEVFRKKGNTDSAFFYANIYHRINDSLHQAVARNRVDVVEARLDFEKTSNRINALLDERNAEKARRNFLLACIFFLLAGGWFYFRWQRQRHNARQQSLSYEKEKAESEIQHARKQLDEFTQHSIEKNEIIEKLQQQLQQQNMQVNDELLNQSILTENDWLRFKDIFDKANPGFITQLKSIAPDITAAEIRLAALIRLNLGNKHISSMLGIGADAVRKTKSRLRQRLQLSPETELEDFIKAIRLSTTA